MVVLIVQVAHQPGFEDIFLPLLSKETTVQLKVKAISFDTFEMATTIRVGRYRSTRTVFSHHHNSMTGILQIVPQLVLDLYVAFVRRRRCAAASLGQNLTIFETQQSQTDQPTTTTNHIITTISIRSFSPRKFKRKG
jgi:hypothetical protein